MFDLYQVAAWSDDGNVYYHCALEIPLMPEFRHSIMEIPATISMQLLSTHTKRVLDKIVTCLNVADKFLSTLCPLILKNKQT